MFYQEKVRQYYKECVALNNKISPELKRALGHHERVPVFVDNLALEIKALQEHNLKKNKEYIEEKFIKDLVYDMVDIFIIGLEEKAKEMQMSDIEKSAKKAKADAARDLENSSNGNISGEYEELTKDGGMTIDDSRSILS